MGQKGADGRSSDDKIDAWRKRSRSLDLPGRLRSIDAKIDAWRKGLLDNTSRNPMISFRVATNSRARSQLELTDPGPAALFGTLASGQARYIRYSEPELDQNEEGEEEDIAARRGADEILTSVGLTRTWRPLKTIEKKAREFEQEQGVNVLAIACGFLRWREASNSELDRLAPLLLLPVAMTDEPTHSRYKLLTVDDDPVTNPSLLRRLQDDFRLVLPEFIPPEQDPAQGLEDWYAEIEGLIQDRVGWSVERRSFLALFSFLKLTMYDDLDRHRADAAENAVVRALAGDATALHEALKSTAEPPSEDGLDSQVPPTACFQILDADASQQVAIEAAKAGNSFILHGPPGTGKSQTIANLIAEFLAAGKTVLFVSEKMAALDVVLKHLRDHRLDDFCLPMHSHRAQKTEVYGLLRRSLEGVRAVAGTDLGTLEAMPALRRSLNDHAHQLNQLVSPLQWPPVRVRGELARIDAELADAAAPLLSFHFERPEGVSGADIEALKAGLEAFQPVWLTWCGAAAHPWRGTAEGVVVDPNMLAASLGSLSQGLAVLDDAIAAVASASGQPAPDCFGAVELFLERARLIARNPGSPPEWLGARRLASVRRNADFAEGLCRSWHERHDALIEDTGAGFDDLDHSALLEALAEPELVRLFPGPDGAQALVAGGGPLRDRLGAAAAAVRALLPAVATLAELLGRSAPEDLDAARTVMADGEVCARAERLEELWFEASQWPLADAVAEEGERRASTATEGRRLLVRAAAMPLLDLDATGLFASLARSSRGVGALVGGRRRREVLATVGHALGRAAPPTVNEALALLKAASEVMGSDAWLASVDSEARRLLGTRFDGPRTDWPALRRALADCQGVEAALRRCEDQSGRQAIMALMALDPAQRRDLSAAHQAAQPVLQDSERAVAALADYLVPPEGGWAATSLPVLASMIEAAEPFFDAYGQATAGQFDLASGPRSLAVVQQHLATAAELTHERKGGQLAQNAESLGCEFGSFYASYDTDWPAVRGAIEWAQAVRDAFDDEVRSSVIEATAQPTGTLDALPVAEQSLATVAPLLDLLKAWFPGGLDGRAIDRCSIAELTKRVVACAADVTERQAWLDYRRVEDHAVRLGLAPFAVSAVKAGLRADQLQLAFWHQFWHLWLLRVYDQRPLLRREAEVDLPFTVARFQKADRLLVDSGADRVRQRMAERHQENGYGTVRGGGFDMIGREAGKKRRQKPIRALMAEAGFAVQQLRPCFLMSPLSVATYLGAADGLRFDAVIFDEASQVRTQDAIGAILRGTQLIVAGDDRQLPPTNFFQKVTEGDEDEPEEQQYDNYDSVLDELASSGLKRHRLRCHYRSRREALIAFSNSRIYDDEPLYTFPEPEAGSKADPALRFELVPDGRYLSTQGNPVEARRVAQAVMAHFKERPEWSLGVIAFGQSHQLAVEEALRAARRSEPDLEGYFDAGQSEALFVKNLETVQGDERDAIILTIGYGRAADGKIRRFFGPLNGEGGERRLNVAITRAKHRLTVVSSIAAGDLSVEDATNRGPGLLRDYLQYAETGWLQVDRQADEFDSPLESDVCQALRAEGLLVDTQVGCSGYRIDLAIRDPQSGRYVLGVECDGAMYHSAKTARDRDRLRQDVLEDRGWRLVRIWSTDWLRDRRQQMKRVLEACAKTDKPIRKAVVSPPPPTPPSPPTAPPPPAPPPVADVWPGTSTYRAWRPPATTYRKEVLYGDVRHVSGVVRDIVACEGPISESLITERARLAYGVGAAGSTVRGQIKLAVAMAVRDGRIRRRGDFLWPAVDVQLMARRPEPGDLARKIQDVPPEEIIEAAVQVIRGAGGIDHAALLTAVSRCLGYERTGKDIANRIEQTLTNLAAEPRVDVRDDRYYPA